MTLIIIVKSRYRTRGKEDEKEKQKFEKKAIQESEPKVKKEINEDNGGV